MRWFRPVLICLSSIVPSAAPSPLTPHRNRGQMPRLHYLGIESPSVLLLKFVKLSLSPVAYHVPELKYAMTGLLFAASLVPLSMTPPPPKSLSRPAEMI